MTLTAFLDPEDVGGIDDKAGIGLYPPKWWFFQDGDGLPLVLRRLVINIGIDQIRNWNDTLRSAYESQTVLPLRRPGP